MKAHRKPCFLRFGWLVCAVLGAAVASVGCGETAQTGDEDTAGAAAGAAPDGGPGAGGGSAGGAAGSGAGDGVDGIPGVPSSVFEWSAALCAPSGVGAQLPLVAYDRTWYLNPSRDTFAEDAPLDLRHLNEAEAGQSGFVRASSSGDGFVLGDGTPVRFWALTTGVHTDESVSSTDLAYHARFLAKRGINMVRAHHTISAKAADINAVDEAEVDQIFRLVAAMKKEGIYTTVSFYWVVDIDAVPAGWNLAGYPGTGSPFGVLFYGTELQNAYKAWARALFGRQNPYTGKTLCEDPALAMIQLQNEDSLLFWTVETLPAAQRRIFGKQFGDRMVAKYGSLDAAFAAWSNTAHGDDDRAAGVLGFLHIWELTQERTGGVAARLADQLEFYTTTMHRFNAAMAEFLRTELGCHQLINAGNWRTADMVRLNDAERYSYTANEALALNRYYGGHHIGENNGWRIDPGHRYSDVSALTNPCALPSNIKKAMGHTMSITETTWVAPMRFQSEGPLLLAAYQALAGIDAVYWFADGSVDWLTDPRFPWWTINGQNPLRKWDFNTPPLLGSLPATALIYRLGYVKKGAAVLHEERSLEELWQRKIPLVTEPEGFDPNRDEAGGPTGVQGYGANPLSFLVGPVRVRYGGDSANNDGIELSPYIDATNRVVRSITSELELDFGQGVFRVDAPKAQAVAGFLAGKGQFALSDVTFESTNDYATIIAASLDEAPLASSRSVLVQVTTDARLTNFSAVPETFTVDDQTVQGWRVVTTGNPPWRITNTEATVSIRNGALTRAHRLDLNGSRAEELSVTRDGERLTVTLPANAMYAVIE